MDELPPYLARSGDALTIEVFVQPRSAKDALVGVHGRALKLKVTAPPVDGRANDAVVELFAKWLAVPRSGVEVVAGRSSRHKQIRVLGTTPERVTSAVAAVLSSRAHDGG
jgi:uncharacterized protein (TIGR00251 family)